MPNQRPRLLFMGTLWSLVFAAVVAVAADETDPSDLEKLFGEKAAAHLYIPEVVWRPDHRTVVWVDRSDVSNAKLMEFDPSGGNRRMLLDEDRLTTIWGKRSVPAPNLDSVIWRPGGNAMLMAGGEDPVIFDFAADVFRILDAGAGEEEHPWFSPDGRRIAWVRDNDLWVYDLETDQETRLTDDGSETVSNGVFDWIYEEELAGRDGRSFRWAGDGSAIVWLRLDDGELPIHHLVDLMNDHSVVTEQRYPTPGDPSPRPSLHVVRFGGVSDSPARVDIAFDNPPPYVPLFGFTPGGDLWYQELDRPQETLQLVRVDLGDRTRTVLVTETDPFWTEPVDGPIFLRDGSFLWLSRQSGHSHVIRIPPDGAPIDLSPDPWEVTCLVGVDPAERVAWYQAARPNPMERHLYAVDLRSGKTTALTSVAGTHSGTPSATGEILVTSSSHNRPPNRWLITSAGAKGAEIPVEHPIPEIPYGDYRFVGVAADDGISLDAMLLLPRGFDETKTYPVVIYTYGGPHRQVVTDAWPRTSGLFNHILAGRGLVVFALDNRGSAGRGRGFEGSVDGALGSKQLPDQLAGVRWLRAQPWVDPERIGIWGWSYGGYMTAYALTHAPGTFAAGAAVAPVTDWRLYDSVYTERYMGSPEVNPEGYAAGSVLDAVAGLSDPLLVIHGMGDDNVHVQHTLQFAERAWREGVRFDLMLFPSLTHGINAPGSHLQVFGAIADFFEEHLAEGEDR